MDKKLYIIREEMYQVDFETKAKFLYTSELNKNIVNLLEARGDRFVYLSNSFGIVDSEDKIKPYKVKSLSTKDRYVWSLLNAEMIRRYCNDMNINTIIFMFSENYKELNDRLKWFGFNLESPLKYFRNSKMKNKWVLNELQDCVTKKL